MNDTQPKLEISTLLAHTDFLEVELARVRITRDRWDTAARTLNDRLCAAQTERDAAKTRCDLAVRIAERVQDERDNANALCKAARSVANAAEGRANSMEHNLRRFEKLAQERLAECDEAKAKIDRLMDELTTGEIAWERDHDAAELQEHRLDDMIDIRIIERDEARAIACRLLTERNRARGEERRLAKICAQLHDQRNVAVALRRGAERETHRLRAQYEPRRAYRRESHA